MRSWDPREAGNRPNGVTTAHAGRPRIAEVAHRRDHRSRTVLDPFSTSSCILRRSNWRRCSPASRRTELQRTGRANLDQDVQAFAATDVVGSSSDAGYAEAERWLADTD